MLNSIIEFLSNDFILFTSFISILTLIAIYLTIAEMKNQRKSSFRPNFVMKSQVYGIRFNDEKYLNYDILKENEMKNSSGSNEPPFISAKLFNVGLGPAKYLEFEWDYNIVNLISFLNKNQSQFNFVIEKKNDNQNNLFIYRKDKQLIKNDLGFKNYRDYALPVSISSHGIEVFIPSSYLDILVSVAFLYKISESKKEILKYYEIFRSNLKIKTMVLYKDIEGNSYKQYFTLVPYLNLLKIFAANKNEDKSLEFGFNISEEIKK